MIKVQMQHQVILLNGPPTSGKDEAAQTIMRYYPTVRHRKMAAPIKNAVASMFGLSYDDVQALEQSGNNHMKDIARLDLLGMTWRQALIWMSEEVMKPKFGQDVFGRLMLNELLKPTASKFSVISDSGFRDEALPVIKRFGGSNVHLFRITRPHTSFVGDSRSHWEPEGACKLQEVDNRFDRRLFRIDILRRVDNIMGVERDYESVT